MTVKELLELNAMIGDVDITVMHGDKHCKLDALHIGPDYGTKPPYPDMVPISEQHCGCMQPGTSREATYIRKSINAFDDGKDYFEIKLNRFPSGWLDLEVWSWESRSVYYPRHTKGDWNVGTRGIVVYALSAGTKLSRKAEEKKVKAVEDEQLEGQTNIYDFLGGVE